ncbi:hypothetical protein HanHA300_Chr12g0447381 [Helianthus annuus]|nr:hypothetical protein HanHA300_Chr12g0447381 [Helianthus annuus]KAJ0505651.1 hypothetical protein HanHA89_Chr12g0472901 [Helianthus annuus]KAJ0675319.1 hypothetical protein HanLR1_Chr12g0449831 [Helianthus annuus]KAJ0678617.1 hypothetical protein HanOQP8_Chr12g0449921 [Helianthus annuus]
MFPSFSQFCKETIHFNTLNHVRFDFVGYHHRFDTFFIITVRDLWTSFTSVEPRREVEQEWFLELCLVIEFQLGAELVWKLQRVQLQVNKLQRVQL